MRVLRATLACLVLLALAFSLHAQQTGIPPFSTVGGGPDQINLGNFSIHYTFPVFSKTGRGLPFSYATSYDNAVWSKVPVVGGTRWSLYLGGASTPIGRRVLHCDTEEL